MRLHLSFKTKSLFSAIAASSNKNIKFASKNKLAGTRKEARAPYLKRYALKENQ